MIYFIGRQTDVKGKEFTHSTMSECVDFLHSQKVIGLDIETTRKYNGKYELEGLDPYLSNIVMLQIGTVERQYVIDVRYIDISPLKSILEHSDIVKVGHNIKFEYKHLLGHGIRLQNVYDSMVVEQIIYSGIKFPRAQVQVGDKIKNYDGFSLEDLLYRYQKKIINKETRLEFLNIKDRPFTSIQIEYGADDIVYPLLIREEQLVQVHKKDVSNTVSLEMLFLLVIADIEYKGMHFDQNVWKATYDINLPKFNRLREELDEFVLTKYPASQFINKQLDLFSDEIKCNIQWTSSKQVIDFFRWLGICPQAVSKETKKLSYTVNAQVLRASLNTFNKGIPEDLKNMVLTYLDFKEAEQSVTTFGIKFFKYVNPITNRLHSNYKQILNTGRISSSGPNLQNIPSDNSFRSAFTAPKGWKIVNADYSGQEQIILANKSNDKDLQYFYEQNLGDMHSYIASKIFPELSNVTLDDIKKYHKDKRQIAKAAGFAINYGGTGYTIADNLGIPEKQGDEVYNAYFKAFPNLKKYFNQVQNEALLRGYILIDPITGRKNWFTSPRSEKEVNKIKRNALNYPIQGEAGGITKLAPILFRQWILENELQDVVFITNLVHDEINVEVHESYAQLAAKNLEICMKKAADKWCKTIPLNADAVITDYWQH
jgi:DNA polymerase I-like protein with 3'-5' exonuclease and polymerase domains